MGIRNIAMGSEPTQYKEYNPRSDFNPRYDGNYDGSKYKEIEDEPTNLISIRMIITYAELGPEFDMNNQMYEYNPSRAEFRAKEIAYDRLVDLVGKGFESKYSMAIEAVDSYTEYEITIILTPSKR